MSSILKSSLERLAQKGLIQSVSVIEEELMANPNARLVFTSLNRKDAVRQAYKYINSKTEIIQNAKGHFNLYVISK